MTPLTDEEARRIYCDDTAPCAQRLRALQALLRRGQGTYGPRGQVDADGNLLKPGERASDV